MYAFPKAHRPTLGSWLSVALVTALLGLALFAGPAPAGRVAVACLVVGLGLLTAAETAWAHAIGVVALFGFIVSGFLGAVPALLAGDGDEPDAATPTT